jgi:hypothetical protein
VDKAGLETLLAKIDVWLLIFGVVVVIGVAGESFFGIRHWWNSRKLTLIQDEESVGLRAEVARLGNATAEANARAAEANQKAEQERLARLTLEQIAPRTLTVAQAVNMVAGIKGFANQKCIFVTYQDDKEAMGFAGQINTVLHMAGWTVEPSKGFLAFILEFNVSVMVDPTANEGTRKAADAFIRVFSEHGVPTTEKPAPGSTSEADTIQIRVGKKP